METPVHPFESHELTEPSTLPVGDATDLGKNYSQLYAISIFVSTCSCAPRVFRRASQAGAAGPRSTLRSGVRGKARIVGRVLQSSSADRAESLGL